MKLYEIEAGEPIQIIASTESNTFECMTIVEFCKEGVLFVEPIRYEDKLLDFTSEQLHISVVHIFNNEKPLIWEGCAIRYVQTKTQKYHAIICRKDGMKWNRRQSFRQYIGLPGSIFIEETRKRREVIVKNVSTTGVSFVMEPADMDKDDIGRFRLEYEDVENRLNVQLHGTVVREEDIDENKKVFGASIDKANLNLSTYIVMKQKQEISKKRGK